MNGGSAREFFGIFVGQNKQKYMVKHAKSTNKMGIYYNYVLALVHATTSCVFIQKQLE